MANRFERALQGQETAIKRRDEELEGAAGEFREFDPRGAAEESARAQYEAVSERMGEDFERLRDRQAGAGRLRTGFGFRDQDRFMRDRLDRLNRTLAQSAMDFAGMRQDQLGTAAQMQGRNLSRRGRLVETLQTERNRSDREAGNIGGTIGSALGGIAGAAIPGLGPGTGALIGGGAGRGIAGLF